MRTVEQALDWLQRRVDSGTTAYYFACEKLQREAWGVEPARYSSATNHFHSVPKRHRYGKPKSGQFIPGQVVVILNGGAGHIVTILDAWGNCYTNDYGGRGRVVIAHVSKVITWAGGTDWYACDPWWGAGYNSGPKGDTPAAAHRELCVFGTVRFRLGAHAHKVAGAPNTRRKRKKKRGAHMRVQAWKYVRKQDWLQDPKGFWYRSRRTDWKRPIK